MAAFMFLASKRHARDMHRQITTQSLAMNGEGKEVNKVLERLEKECD